MEGLGESIEGRVSEGMGLTMKVSLKEGRVKGGEFDESETVKKSGTFTRNVINEVEPL
jgi:hypothetical protein